MDDTRSKRARVRAVRKSWDAWLQRDRYAGLLANGPGELGAPEVSPAFDWWMAEICRFVYTPDHREVRRFKVEDIRPSVLQNTPMEEVANLHKTGTHVAIYRVSPPGKEPWTLVVFRGSTRFRQWVVNLSAMPIQFALPDSEKMIIHQGFRTLFDRVWPLLEPLITEHASTGRCVYAGHSLGGAMAMLASLYRPPSDGTWTFGAPRVGNQAFRDGLEARGVRLRRFVNHRDLVALLPHSVERLAPFDFCHAGDFLYLDRKGALHENPAPEVLGDDSWKPHLPLTYLAKSMRDGRPPEGIIDHSLLEYCAKLRVLAE